jgi:hypothetical protein
MSSPLKKTSATSWFFTVFYQLGKTKKDQNELDREISRKEKVYVPSGRLLLSKPWREKNQKLLHARSFGTNQMTPVLRTVLWQCQIRIIRLELSTIKHICPQMFLLIWGHFVSFEAKKVVPRARHKCNIFRNNYTAMQWNVSFYESTYSRLIFLRWVFRFIFSITHNNNKSKLYLALNSFRRYYEPYCFDARKITLLIISKCAVWLIESLNVEHSWRHREAECGQRC